MQVQNSNYFENSKRATLAQRQYCIANPGGFLAYSDSLWGLTAGDDQDAGYTARGAPPAQNDNGTISPTAGSRRCRSRPPSRSSSSATCGTTGAGPWGTYGYKDGFRPQTVVATDVLASTRTPVRPRGRRARREGLRFERSPGRRW